MKVRQIEQNTEEWLEYRKGKSGGSEFKDLWIAGLPKKEAIIAKLEEDGQELSPADKREKVAILAGMLEPEELVELKIAAEPKKRYYEIIAERVARPITPNDYAEELNGESFSMMARGHILEPVAVAKFCEITGKGVDAGSVVWESEDSPFIYISPDATITDEDGKVREAVEVKCLDNAKTIEAYLTGKYPKEYEPQIIKYFVVNEDLEKLHFTLYSDTIPGLEIQIFEIKREDVAERIAEAKAFEITIMQMIDRDAKKIEALSF